MSIELNVEIPEFPDLTIANPLKIFEAPGLPPAAYEAEAGPFARQVDVPGHVQPALEGASIVQVGGGGLGSWTGLGLIRSGARALTIIEHDRFDRTNGSRQLMYSADLGEPKAFAVGQNLVPHAMIPARITSIALPFEAAVEQFALAADALVVLVDNNPCRLAAARYARERRIPAIFSMLSRDSMRCHTFLQGPHPWDPCLRCALPNLDPQSALPCAAAVISSCFLSAAYTVFFVHRALMGWPEGAEAFNWREADLLGAAPERTGVVKQRPDCPTCSSGGRNV